MFRILSIAVLAFYLCMSPPAGAAVLSQATGDVLVNSGRGFQPVSASSEVAPGAQIMVRDRATAVIAYNASCSVKIGGGRIWTVAPKAPCAPGATLIDMTTASGATGNQDDNNLVPPPLDWFGPTVVIGGTGALGYLAYRTFVKDNNNPASP